MTEAYTDVGTLEVFLAARKHFAALVEVLQTQAVCGLEHSEVEALITKDGTEVLRCLLQGHLALRSRNEAPQAAVVGRDGIRRGQCREGSRRLESLFGTVRVERLRYVSAASGVRQICPLDAELNLPSSKYSHGLQRRVLEEAVKSSFDASVESIERQTGGSVPKRQAEALVRRMGCDFEAFYAERALGGVEARRDPLVMSMDGKGIVMRPEGLRPHTRKAAERTKNKLQTRLSRGEKRHRKRMATVASVYSIAPYKRTAEGVMDKTSKAGAVPRARNKRVWASVERDAQTVTEEVFAEAKRRDPRQRRPWVMLVDGQPQQIAQEGACRHLIKDRMDITGARWGLQTAEAILKLRSLKASGDLDEYWQFHIQRERERQYEGYDNIKRAA